MSETWVTKQFMTDYTLIIWLLITDYWFSLMTDAWLITDDWLLITDESQPLLQFLQITDWWVIADYWWLIADYWLLILIDDWLLITDYWFFC